MPVLTRCTSCNQQLQVPDELLGRLLKCPGCGNTFTAVAGGRATPAPPPLPSERRDDVAERPPHDEIQEGPPRRRSDDARIEEDRPRRRDNWDDDEDDGGRRRRRHDDDDYYDDYRPPIRRGLGLRGLSNEYVIDVSEWFHYAKDHYTVVLGPMIGFLMILVLIAILRAIPLLGILVSLAMIFLNPPLQAGFSIVALAQLKGKPWSFGDFFAGFNWYGSLLANYWLMVAINLLCMVPGFFLVGFAAMLVFLTNASALWAVAVMGGLISFGLIIYVGVRTACFSVQLIVDRDCGPIEAIQGSWQLSSGHFWGLFGVNLLLGLFVLAGLLALLVGALFAVPFVVLTMNAGYLLITDREAFGRVSPPFEQRDDDYDERR